MSMTIDNVCNTRIANTGHAMQNGWYRESAGRVVVTTPACDAGGTGSIAGTGSCDVKIWLSTLGTVYRRIGESR